MNQPCHAIVQFFVSFLISSSLTVSPCYSRIIMGMKDEPKRPRVEFPAVSACDYINYASFFFPHRSATTATSPTIMAANLAISSGDLLDIVSSSASATIYPSDDIILSVLQARFRSDLPYTRIRNTNLLVVNPYKTVNDASGAREYEERCYKDTSRLPQATPTTSI